MKIEPLEPRIAPATILTFPDVDGDTVKIISNKALTASITFTATQNPSELLISGAGLDGASITTVVTRGPDGDGLVNIGRIVATGLDLGAVTIKGDLGKIDCGNPANALPALKSLKVHSMGSLGLSTQVGGNLLSSINGDVGSITVVSDVLGSRFGVVGDIGMVKIGGDLRGDGTMNSGRILAKNVKSISIGGDLVAGGGDESGKILLSGDLGKLFIGGSMRGALDGVADSTGQINVAGNAGPIMIKGDIFGAQSQQRALNIGVNANTISIGGSIFGQGGRDSGSIFIAGNAGAITIGRDLNGSGGNYSGAIFIEGGAGKVKIGQDINGSSGAFSAAIDIAGTIGGFSVGGDIRGGSGAYQDGVTARQIFLSNSTGPIRIGGDVIGGPNRASGTFILDGNAPSFFLGGSVIGGGTAEAGIGLFPGGSIALGSVAKVSVMGHLQQSEFAGGHLLIGSVDKLLVKGSVIATDKQAIFNVPGAILFAGNVKSARIEGSIIGSPFNEANDFNVLLGGSKVRLEILGSLDGGGGFGSGSVLVNGTLESGRIGGSLRSGFGHDTGTLKVNGHVKSLTIGGGVEGASGSFSASQVTASSYGKVTVGGDLVGNPTGGGELRAFPGGFESITVKGSLYAGSAGGSIFALQGLGVVKVGGNVSGGFSTNHTSIFGLNAKSITIGGDVFANGSSGNSILTIRESAGAISIGGSMRGSANEPAYLIFGLDAGYSTLAFTRLMIKGSVSNGIIGAGFNASAMASNGDAVLGPITIGGNFIASSIAAGVVRGPDLDYASADDTPVANMTPALSRIASITIKGQVFGTTTANDHFGFVAQSIGPVKIAGVSYTANSVPIDLSPITHDFTVRLV